MVDRVINVRFQETGGAQVVSTFQRIGAASQAVGRQTAAAQQGLVRVGQQASTTARQAQASAAGFAAAATSAGRFSTTLGTLNRVFGGLIAFETLRRGLTGAVQDFANFERGLIAVGKTTDLAGGQLQAFGAGIDDLTKRLPLTAQELLRIAEAAGTLGIRGEANLLKFTEVIAKLSRTTDLNVEEAVRSFGRLIAITDATVDDIGQLGSVVTILGNTLSTTERFIIAVAEEIAGVANAAGVGSTDILAMSGSFAALGLEAERSRTVVTDFFRETTSAIGEGGERVQLFADTIGTTIEEFERLRQQDPGELFRRFVAGLAEANDAGVNLQQRLEDLGLTNARTLTAFLQLAGGVEEVEKAFKNAREEAVKINALDKEFNETLKALTAQWGLLENAVGRFSRSLVSEFRPGISGMIDDLTDVVLALEHLQGAFSDFINRNRGAFDAEVFGLFSLRDALEALSRFPGVPTLPKLIELLGKVAEPLANLEKSTAKLTELERELNAEIAATGTTADATAGQVRTFSDVMDDLGVTTRTVTTDVRDHTDATTRFIETLNAVPLFETTQDWQRLGEVLRDTTTDWQQLGTAVEVFTQQAGEADQAAINVRESLKSSEDVIAGASAGFREFFNNIPSAAQSAFDAINGGLQTVRDTFVDFLTTGEFDSKQFWEALKRHAFEFFVDQLFSLLKTGGDQLLDFFQSGQSAGETMFSSLGSENSDFWGQFVDLAQGAGGFLKGVLSQMGSDIGDLFEGAAGRFNDLVGLIVKGIKALGSSDIGQAIISGVSTIGSTVKTVVTGAFNTIKSIFFADGGLVEAFAPGGLVSGPGGPRDDQILARLSAGEYVINAQAVRLVGTDFLDAVNDNQIRRFQTGGIVENALNAINAAEGGFSSPISGGGILDISQRTVPFGQGFTGQPGTPGGIPLRGGIVPPSLTGGATTTDQLIQAALDAFLAIQRQKEAEARAFNIFRRAIGIVTGLGVPGIGALFVDAATGIIQTAMDDIQGAALGALERIGRQEGVILGGVRSAVQDISALPGRVERDFSTIQTNALRIAGEGTEQILVGGFENLADQYNALGLGFASNVNSIAGRQFQGPFISRRFGGPVSGGRLYETHGLGDREFFVPDQSGQIVSGEGGDLRELTRLTRTNNMILRDIARSERVNAENTTQMRRSRQSRTLAGQAA